jgi:NhaP-type Na+/H+ or K+/H+ antiporter
MPLSLMLGAWLALLLFPALHYWPAFVLAALLMPTDAALGEATVTNPNVPEYMRQSLNAESGLNDGLALPAVLVLVELANLGATGYLGQNLDMEYWQGFLSSQLVVGGGTGVALGLVGGALLDKAATSHAMSPTSQRLRFSLSPWPNISTGTALSPPSSPASSSPRATRKSKGGSTISARRRANSSRFSLSWCSARSWHHAPFPISIGKRASMRC